MLLLKRLRIPGLASRLLVGASSLFMPDHGVHVQMRRRAGERSLRELIEDLLVRGNVVGILTRPDARLLYLGVNIVTDAGDIYFAQRSAGEAPTNAFTTWEMASAGTPGKAAIRSGFTVIGGSQLVQDATYPKSNDGDTDNTGRATDARTTRVSYTAASFNHAAITHGIVTNASPAAGEPLLAGWAWAASINKTAADTLKAFHNATCNGV